MTTFKIHTLETVPEGSKAMLTHSQKAYGRIPNLHGVLAESPSTFEAYQTLHRLFTETSFNEEELTVIWQSINVANECHYCVPAHTAIAHSMKVDPALTEALRNEEPMPTKKLQALQDMTLSIVRNRGVVAGPEVEAFYAAGYGQQQILEILLGLAQKTISNYTNHFAQTPVDASFEKFTWKKEALTE